MFYEKSEDREKHAENVVAAEKAIVEETKKKESKIVKDIKK